VNPLGNWADHLARPSPERDAMGPTPCASTVVRSALFPAFIQMREFAGTDAALLQLDRDSLRVNR